MNAALIVIIFAIGLAIAVLARGKAYKDFRKVLNPNGSSSRTKKGVSVLIMLIMVGIIAGVLVGVLAKH